MTKTEKAEKVDEILEAEVIQEQEPEASPSLDLNDLALALNLVNVAIKRGAYERAELRNVLDVTDKLEAFLQYQAKAQAAAAEKGEA